MAQGVVAQGLMRAGMTWSPKGLAFAGSLLLGLLLPAAGWAIEVHPNQDQIDRALNRGTSAAEARTPPDRLYSWFGSADPLAPHGFLMTKLSGLAVMATHFALRGESPSRSEIDRILADPTLLISVVIYGDRPDFGVDSYLVLSQGDRLIKPASVRFDGRAARSAAWPNPPAYRAKVVATVPYAELDPGSETRITVLPGIGGDVSFDLDFAQIE